MRKAAAEAQHIVLRDLRQYCAASKTVDSALLTILTAHAVLYVIMDQALAAVVQKLTAEILTSVADLAVQHSGLVILIAHVLHKDT